MGRAEAASAAASGGLSGLSVGFDMLTPLINRAKHQLEVERAKGSLHKAMAAAKTNADLPQLDAAIQAAHKAGLQDRVIEASRCRICCLQLPCVPPHSPLTLQPCRTASLSTLRAPPAPIGALASSSSSGQNVRHDLSAVHLSPGGLLTVSLLHQGLVPYECLVFFVQACPGAASSP